MKRRWITAAFALGAAALLGLAGSQARAGDPAPFAPLPAGPAAGVSPPAAVIVAPPAAAACCAPACEAPCLKKVCVPEQAVRTIDKRVYGEVCEDFCVPKCSFGGGLGHHKHDDCGACPSGGCEDGSCASCEHRVRQKKFLVVRIKHEEECYTKCNVAYEPEAPKCCAHGACEAPAGCAGAVVQPPAAPMPPVEKAPPPKEKK